ncbi:hypothetical protein LY78DRAFT_281216 [Colletotrichum sublineola]|nr:hypothetical protein LY78DRAFT_281216 [Colletotrichum sublineola]
MSWTSWTVHDRADGQRPLSQSAYTIEPPCSLQTANCLLVAYWASNQARTNDIAAKRLPAASAARERHSWRVSCICPPMHNVLQLDKTLKRCELVTVGSVCLTCNKRASAIFTPKPAAQCSSLATYCRSGLKSVSATLVSCNVYDKRRAHDSCAGKQGAGSRQGLDSPNKDIMTSGIGFSVIIRRVFPEMPRSNPTITSPIPKSRRCQKTWPAADTSYCGENMSLWF